MRSAAIPTDSLYTKNAPVELDYVLTYIMDIISYRLRHKNDENSTRTHAYAT